MLLLKAQREEQAILAVDMAETTSLLLFEVHGLGVYNRKDSPLSWTQFVHAHK